MKKIYFPIISRGPEIESAIGIFIILMITGIMIFSVYLAYQKLENVFEKDNNYFNKNLEIKN